MVDDDDDGKGEDDDNGNVSSNCNAMANDETRKYCRLAKNSLTRKKIDDVKYSMRWTMFDFICHDKTE